MLKKGTFCFQWKRRKGLFGHGGMVWYGMDRDFQSKNNGE